MKIELPEVGRFVRVRFNDVGCMDGVVVNVREQQDRESEVEVFCPVDAGGTQTVGLEQIVSVGPRIVVPSF